MKEPRDFARSISQFTIPDGTGDRFSGYAVIGLPFSSGHVLAHRYFAASSLGTAYTSVWHRDPKGRWTFHQNVPPEQSCPRYFGAAIAENTTEPIRIDWIDSRRFCVTVDSQKESIAVRRDCAPKRWRRDCVPNGPRAAKRSWTDPAGVGRSDGKGSRHGGPMGDISAARGIGAS
jgi:hypothetical protein